jgi:hypothetical protein
MGAKHNVFEYGHPPEQGDILEGSCDTKGYFVGRSICDVLSVEKDLPGFNEGQD